MLNNQGYLKICDFGLARRLHLDKTTGEPMPNYEYTNRVVTLWYRSPELLLGSTHYSFEVDIWSAGYILLIRCILLEFYVRQAVFRGNTEIQQLGEIFKFCGTPTDENWPSLINLPWTNLVNFEYKERILRKHFSDPSFGLSKEFINLLDALLMLDPSKRPDASLALAHRYFTAEEPFACDAKALPGIEGDWHEYQGKQRQKNAINNPNAKSPVLKIDLRILRHLKLTASRIKSAVIHTKEIQILSESQPKGRD